MPPSSRSILSDRKELNEAFAEWWERVCKDFTMRVGGSYASNLLDALQMDESEIEQKRSDLEQQV